MQAKGRASLSDRPKLRIFSLVAMAGFAADFASKAWAKIALSLQPFTDFRPMVTFELVRNSGAAFSTCTSMTPLLAVIALCAAFVVPYISRGVHSLGWAIALGLLEAGILGNFANRLFEPPGVFRGHVIDFIHVTHFPWVFNVADIWINISAGLILVLSWRGIHLDGSRESNV